MPKFQQAEELPINITCRNCGAKVKREIRCSACGDCPICRNKGLLLDREGDVIPCYNCNPDGDEDDSLG